MQTEVSENSVAKLTPAMPAEVKLQAYQDQVYKGRLRQIFPSADRAKAIVEVRVTILDADAHVKPEMTASVTFQEHKRADARLRQQESGRGRAGRAGRAGAEARRSPSRAASTFVWVVDRRQRAARRPVTLGAERLDQVEVRSGVVAGRGGDPESAGRA